MEFYSKNCLTDLYLRDKQSGEDRPIGEDKPSGVK